MSIGAFGENMPYTNMHDLNMDWIVKIAKDFLDQYTTIQNIITEGNTQLTQTITEGNTQLTQKITEGLASLDAEKDRLEGLLDEWYNTHSNDIATALTYSLAQIEQKLNTSISEFNNSADQKALQTIASIPDDYSTLANTVQNFAGMLGGDVGVESKAEFTHDFYYDIGGTIHTNTGVWKTTDYLPVAGYKAIRFTLYKYVNGSASIASVAFYDKDQTFIPAFDPYYLTSGIGLFTGWLAIPETAVYYTATTKTDQNESIITELYADACPVNLTPFETGGLLMYNHDGTTYTTTSTGPFRESNFVPIANMNRIEYNLPSFHGSGYTLEAVTFFDAGQNRIGGVFPAISDGNRHYYGTAPIPATAKYLKFFYRTDSLNEAMLKFSYSKNLTNILCIGDSITEGAGGVTSYTRYMIDLLGSDYTVFNAGKGGANASSWWSENIRGLLTLTGVNIVTIMLGLNGGMSDTFDTDVDPYDDYAEYANTITGCTCKMIEWLQENVPDALIVFVTPTYAISTTHEQQAENQIACIPELVERYNIPVIDVHTLCGVNAKNASNFILADNVHDNDKYSRKIAMAMSNQIKSIANYPYN